jgi:hypothetical protein
MAAIGGNTQKVLVGFIPASHFTFMGGAHVVVEFHLSNYDETTHNQFSATPDSTRK